MTLTFRCVIRASVTGARFAHHRPMKKASDAQTSETTAYTLRDIPSSLWKQARIRAIENDLGMRDVLTGLLRAYVAGKVEPIA